MSNHSYCQTFIEYTVTGGCKYVFDIIKDFNMLENGVHNCLWLNRNAEKGLQKYTTGALLLCANRAPTR